MSRPNWHAESRRRGDAVYIFPRRRAHFSSLSRGAGEVPSAHFAREAVGAVGAVHLQNCRRRVPAWTDRSTRPEGTSDSVSSVRFNNQDSDSQCIADCAFSAPASRIPMNSTPVWNEAPGPTEMLFAASNRTGLRGRRPARLANQLGFASDSFLGVESRADCHDRCPIIRDRPHRLAREVRARHLPRSAGEGRKMHACGGRYTPRLRGSACQPGDDNMCCLY